MENNKVVELDDGTVYAVVMSNDGVLMKCNNCCARNNSVLCAQLNKKLSCSDHNVSFVPLTYVKDTNDVVNKPKHYMLSIKDYNIEVRDVCKALANRLGDKGYSGMFISDYVQLMQYLMRFDSKNGKEDLEKASWYLNKLLDDYEVPTR